MYSEQEIKQLRREIDRKEVIISQQDISPAEVKRMTMARHEVGFFLFAWFFLILFAFFIDSYIRK